MDSLLEVLRKLKSCGFRVEADCDAQKINYKIREHSLKKTPYILAIGKKESESGTVSVRKLGEETQQVISIDEFISMAQKQISEKL